MATYSSILAWRTPWKEEPGGATVHGVAKSRTQLSDFTHSLIINKAEVDVFLELFFFFCDPMDVGNLISGSSAFSKSSLNV